MNMTTVTTAWLQTIEALKHVPEEQLQWLIDHSEHQLTPEGEHFFRKGDALNKLVVIVSGGFFLYNLQNNEQVEIARVEAGSITGYLPFSRATNAFANGLVTADMQHMSLSSTLIPTMISTQPGLTEALVHVMTDRVRDYTTQQLHNEKMTALGKLSAGLAHELNNPASAVVRGADMLKKHLKVMPDYFKEVISIRMGPEDVDRVKDIMFEALEGQRPQLTMMQRSEKEDEIADWLSQYPITNLNEIAENFTDVGFTLAQLDEIKKHVGDKDLSPLLNWINKNIITDKMVTDIEDASQRISVLVKSVKTFTHMDQGHAKQLGDIHDGLSNTLTLLEYKLRKNNIKVAKHFDPHLPPVKFMIGEMNQVWTNLIDNAIDAMEVNREGVLEIRTELDRDCVKVHVIDNGPGVPDEIKSHIFDPFFTTKSIGKGTGLGLDIVCQIIKKQHKGTIKLDSVPGRTDFWISIPING